MNGYILPIIGLLALTASVSKSASLELAFPDGITWKAVFDKGFRPKHVPSLQTERAECLSQELVFRFRDRPGFQLDGGRLMFELQSDDSIRVIEHVSRVPVSMEEGARRMEAFHRLFESKLRRRGSTPPLMDKEHGGVAALSDYYAAAEDEGYTIHYGFTGSFQRDKPLLPIFMIALRHNMKAVPLPIRRHTVEPPKGYEWYSLDPKVNTPDPGSIPEALPGVGQKTKAVQQSPLRPNDIGKQKAPKTEVVKESLRWVSWLGLLFFLLVALGIGLRKIASGR